MYEQTHFLVPSDCLISRAFVSIPIPIVLSPAAIILGSVVGLTMPWIALVGPVQVIFLFFLFLHY